MKRQFHLGNVVSFIRVVTIKIENSKLLPRKMANVSASWASPEGTSVNKQLCIVHNMFV